MFLHLGKNVVIPKNELIAIIGLKDNPSEINRAFLKTAAEEDFVIQLGGEPVSCIVAERNIYLSPISVETLRKRGGRHHFKDNLSCEESW